jgi:putative copper resistance protein D
MLSLLFGRWAHIYSSSILLSLFAFQRLYVIPVLDRERRSNLAEESCLDALKWICWLVMLISGINWLLVIVASISNSGIQLATLEEVIGVTQFGHLWLFRSFLGLAIAGGLLYDRLRKRSYAHLDWLCIGLAAVNLGSLAWAGHAGAGTGSFANFHLLTDLVHLLVSAVWPGGLLPLIIWFFVKPGRRENEPDAIVRRFSAISRGAVVILAVSGLLNTLFMIRRLADFWTTAYGEILALKIVIFLIMLALGAQNQRLLKVRRQTALGIDDRSNAKRLFRNVYIESALAFIVFGIVGVLGAIEPPVN